MAKTLHHYRQQIRSLASGEQALDRARSLGHVLIDAKAAVRAAGQPWSEWLEAECDLSDRTARRFMTIARRWEEPTFVEARRANPELPLREADKVLAASSGRKRVVPQAPAPLEKALHKLATAAFELAQVGEIHEADRWAGDEIEAARVAVAAAHKALFRQAHGEESTPAWAGSFEPRPRWVELQAGDRCECMQYGQRQAGTITAVHPAADGGWSTYSWQADGVAESVRVGWGYPGGPEAIRLSIAKVLPPLGRLA